MSNLAIRRAIWDYVRDQWGSKTLIVDAENDASQGPPSDLVPWLTLVFYPATERQVTLGEPGQRCYREDGVVGGTIFVPSGEGADDALQYAEDFRNIIRGQQLTDSVSGQVVQLLEADPPNTALPSEVQASSGNWFGYEVTSSYRSDVGGL